jgi:hypothetical protein
MRFKMIASSKYIYTMRKQMHAELISNELCTYRYCCMGK